MARKACDYYEVGQKTKNGQYKEAGKKIAEIQMRRVKGTAKAAMTAAGTVCNGVKAAYTDDTEAAKKFRRGLRNCAIIGGTVLLASEAVDAIDDTAPVEAASADDVRNDIDITSGEHIDLPDADGAGNLLPMTDVDDMPGVEDGMLIDDSPNNLAEIAKAGEFNDTQHLSDVIRSQDARMEFLAQNDLERVPSG